MIYNVVIARKLQIKAILKIIKKLIGDSDFLMLAIKIKLLNAIKLIVQWFIINKD